MFGPQNMAEVCVEGKESCREDSEVLEENVRSQRTINFERTAATSTAYSIGSSLLLIFQHHDIVYVRPLLLTFSST